MTVSDFLLLAAFVAAALYAICRLLLGWLQTRPLESATEETDEVSPSSRKPPPQTG